MEAQQIEQQQYIQKTHQTNMYQMQNIFQQEKTQYLYQERRTQKEIHKECM